MRPTPPPTAPANMFFRGLAYVLLGWLAMAAVASFGHVAHLSVMLPSTTAVLLVHLAFAREGTLPAKLAIAAMLGYLEDLHQGAPLGTLMLAHQLTFLALHWSAGRLALHGWASRASAALVAVALIDLATWATLMVLAEPLRIPRDALMSALWQSRWHLLATFLVAHPVWVLTDSLLRALRIDRPKSAESENGASS
ncbi:hypothetical protein ACNOYE_21010 [Nannocystaceae bacterium ST9]